jgi:predicted ATP-grasp superfamily ATP-dependent carboligase
VLAEQFELIGLFGVDMIFDGEQMWVIEVNPRYTASMEVVERASGVHAVEAHSRACRGLGISELRAGRSAGPSTRIGVGDDPARGDPPVFGKAILFAKREVVISQRFGEAALGEALRLPWPSLADVSPPGTLIEAGRPILTMFANGSTTDDVEQRLIHRAGELERQIYLGSS